MEALIMDVVKKCVETRIKIMKATEEVNKVQIFEYIEQNLFGQ
jgi:hypothetical protein